MSKRDTDPLTEHLATFIDEIGASLDERSKHAEGGDSYTMHRPPEGQGVPLGDPSLFATYDGAPGFSRLGGSGPVDSTSGGSTAREAMLRYALEHNPALAQELADSVWMTDRERALIAALNPSIALPSESDNANRKRPSEGTGE